MLAVPMWVLFELGLVASQLVGKLPSPETGEPAAGED